MPRPSPHFDHHLAGGPDELAGDLNAVARSAIRKGGVLVGERRGINLIEGTGVTLGVVDNPGSERVDVTVNGPTVPGSLPPDGPAGGDLSGTYPNPQIASGVIVNGDVNASAAIAESKLSLASDAAAGTASRRTIGTGALQACAGNDARLSDQRTPLDGSVTAAKVGTDWPSFRAVKLTQAINNNTLTAVSFTTGNEIFDNGGWHSSTTSVFDVPRTGLYIFVAEATFELGIYDSELAVQITQAGFKRGGVDIVCNGAIDTELGCSAIIRCTAGEDIEMKVYQNTGGTIDIQTATFCGAFIGDF